MNASAGHSSQCSHQLGVAAVADDEARLLLLRAVRLHVGVPKLLCNDVSSALLQWAGMLLGSLNMLLLLLLGLVWQMMLKMVLRMMRNSVKKKAGFDINDVAPIDLVPSSAVPAVFGHGKQDTFINISHSGEVQLPEALTRLLHSYAEPGEHLLSIQTLHRCTLLSSLTPSEPRTPILAPSNHPLNTHQWLWVMARLHALPCPVPHGLMCPADAHAPCCRCCYREAAGGVWRRVPQPGAL
jgi:hypothetical protein